MEYRIHPRTGDRIGVIGIGTSYISEAPEKTAVQALEFSFENGFNFADLATAGEKTFGYFGTALSSVREKMFYQVHFGADYSSGEYGWSTDLDVVKRSVDWQLKQLKTDYIDYGFIHCMDSRSDFEAYQKNGVLQYLLDMKAQGIVRHIGLSSHTPALVQTALDSRLVEMLMFSINPGYDYRHGEYANGSSEERMALYRRCETAGIGISVMKAFSGGQLLSADSSPFGKALTPYQCLQYALDKPGVLTVLPGIRSKADVETLLGFFSAGKEERDYSVLGTFTPGDAVGKCVYCNHCHPCPAGLNISLINKYYDLALAGDSMAADHYQKLEKNASDCIRCGHCDRRCPFRVSQSERMKEIDRYFASVNG